MHAPANAILACIVAGLAISSVASKADCQKASGPAWANTTLRYATVFACLGMIPLLCRDAFTADTLDELRRANTAARVQANKPDAPSAKPLLEAAIDRGERAIEIDPGNWQLAALLGHANLHLAAVDQPDAESEALRLAAEHWFATARRNSAVTRGLPVPASSK
jgi:hypothetical protein